MGIGRTPRTPPGPPNSRRRIPAPKQRFHFDKCSATLSLLEHVDRHCNELSNNFPRRPELGPFAPRNSRRTALSLSRLQSMGLVSGESVPRSEIESDLARARSATRSSAKYVVCRGFWGGAVGCRQRLGGNLCESGDSPGSVNPRSRQKLLNTLQCDDVARRQMPDG